MDVKLETYTIQHLLINKKKYTNKKLYTTIIKNEFTTDNESHEKKKNKQTNKINKQNFSLLQFNTVRFILLHLILCQKVTILSH